MALLSGDRVFGERLLQNTATDTPVAQPVPTTTTTTVTKAPTTTDMVAQDVNKTTTTTPTWSISKFTSFINSDSLMPSTGKTWITDVAKRAAAGDAAAIKALNESLPKMTMSPETRSSLYSLLGIKLPTTTTTTPKTGSGGGGGTSGGGGGGGEGSSGGSGGGTYGQANSLITQLMGGDFTSLPLWAELTDPARNDPYTNPAMQPIIDGIQREMQEDWLGEQAALAELAEAGGRYGSGTYLAARSRATEESSEAVADAISRLLGGAYESEQQRRAGLLGSAMEAMLGSAGLAFNDKASQRQAAAASAANRLARQQFNFSKKMQLATGQQDALSDYLGLLLGIGSLGGTTTTNQSGGGVPAMDPNAAAILGLLGGATQSGGGFGNTGGISFGSKGTKQDTSGDLAVPGMT